MQMYDLILLCLRCLLQVYKGSMGREEKEGMKVRGGTLRTFESHAFIAMSHKLINFEEK